MTTPTFYVDFNEMPEPTLVLLSKNDYRADFKNDLILLESGMRIKIMEADFDKEGRADNLVATGIVERNVSGGWAGHVKWCCRVDPPGIHHQSDSEHQSKIIDND